jgi:hypothetical protein
VSQDRLLEVADQLRRRLVPGDLDATLLAITSAAVDLLPDVDFASITVNDRRGPIRAVAPTDPMILHLDRGQYDCQEGPCYEAATESVHVVSSDLAAERRWPCYAPIALAAGVNAQAGIRLFENRGTLGALNLYSTRLGAFADLAPIGALFSSQAAMALAYAHEIQNLNEAVRTRKTIGQAIGIVMERYALTDERAFAFLARLSQNGNVKLRVVAEQIVAAVDKDAARRARPKDGG